MSHPLLGILPFFVSILTLFFDISMLDDRRRFLSKLVSIAMTLGAEMFIHVGMSESITGFKQFQI